MDFTPADSQQAVAALAAEILGSEALDAEAQDAEAPGGGAPGGEIPGAKALASAGPWKELARAGLLSVGADGLGLLDVAVLLTEIGRRATPVPALATLMTGALPLLRWGRPDLLPAVASGELILTAAPATGPPPTTGPSPAAPPPR